MVFEFNSVSVTVGLLEVDAFGVEEDSVELDIDVNSLEGSIVSCSSQLNLISSTTSMSLLVFLTGWAPRVSFSMVQSPFPQTVKGQGMAWRVGVRAFWTRVNAEREQRRARKKRRVFPMFQLVIILLMQGYH